MKKTIKEDQNRLILESELLNDNTLLEYTADQGYMIVGIRYVESPISGIKEHVLIKMDIADFLKHKEELIEINEDHSAIAIFTPQGDEYVLRGVYNAVSHGFETPEFIDLEYKKAFPSQPMERNFVKKKSKVNEKCPV